VPSAPRTEAHTADVRVGVRRVISSWFFAACAAIAAAVIVVFQFAPAAAAVPGARAAIVLGFGTVVAAALWARQRAQGAWVDRAMTGVLMLGTLALGGAAVVLGWGLEMPGLGYFALFVCVLSAATSPRHGLVLAVFAALVLAAVDAGMRWRGVSAVPPGPWWRLGSQIVLVGMGLLGGVLIAYVVGRYVRSADDREQRFRGLLAIAADAYWEIDEAYRLVALTHQRSERLTAEAAPLMGRVAWELPVFDCDPETLDALIADLDTRAPFRERLVHWQLGDTRHALALSGEPRFDERGVFKGYWGVARDVTRELAARAALAATETRYQELFARIPTPLVLHRQGLVIDANPAALQLFGHDELGTMLGRDLFSSYEAGDSRERERRRIEALAGEPAGAAQPVADFRLTPPTGRRVLVRATAVQVEAAGGPATLSIYVDDTERRAAEEAVRRSETMLSHLVATSPDVITLTDLSTGRYAMVNRTFEKVTGYGVAEVVGRTSVELGIWHHAEDRERFVGLIRQHGQVTDLPVEFVTKDRRVLPMLVSGARFAMDRRDYLVINARDVSETERTRLEREAILENASIGIAVTRDQRFVLANPRFEQMFGWARGALPGEAGSVVWTDAEAYREVGGAIGPALGRGEQVDVERRMRRRDGSTFLARLLARAIDPDHPAKGGTVWIVEDVTERRQFEHALAAARDAAEAASRAKSAFLANTSHELRTPLNGLLHLAELAREPGVPEDRRRQYLDQMADSAKALAGIITDILDLSKIEAGKLALECTTFDLGELLQATQRAYATIAASRELALHLEIDPALAGGVQGDPLRVRQILGNYLSNALKFTATGAVRVVARRPAGAPALVRLEVHDTGPGIDAATQERLFRPFTQADESTTRRYGGTGLGLSICRELAHLMGGEVGVLSEPGRGSVFWAELPLPASLAPVSPVSLPADEHADLRGLRVLMVEDNPVNMIIAVAILERWGVVVEQAQDGKQALEAVQRAEASGLRFDAVLMDVQMPVMSGYEATRVLRRRPGGEALPVIALTAAALVTERDAALAAGMNDFLTKPIDADRLRATLARWARRGGRVPA
jgi:PAS domain S-box-containing protein